MNTRAIQLRGWLCLALFLSFNAAAATYYVNVSNTAPVSPFTNWASAAKQIQDAVDVAAVGDRILVTNGVYQTGGRAITGSVTNRVVVDKAIVVASVSGPEVTTIFAKSPYGTTGPWAIRCVYLSNGAVLEGFTVTGGATQSESGGVPLAQDSGGGVYCETLACILTNCVIIGNLGGQGGGVYGGTLNDCQITYNSAQYGGGISYATANRCVIKNNGQSGGNSEGGGAYGGTLNNCLVVSNSIGGHGGGAVFASLNNCTIVSNSAANGGGVVNCKVTNCIVYFNSSSDPTPNFGEYYVGGITDTLRLKCCCTTPHPGFYGFSAGGNFTNQPSFISFSGGNFHLQTNSPCVNTGSNAFVIATTDLDGNPRIVGPAVDIGAYEKSPVSILPTFWLLPYNLPNDGSADYLDSDGDGLNNWQEWKAGTVPTNSASVLQLASPTNSVSGMVVTWQSVSGVTYYLQRSSDLAGGFTSIVSNLIGQAGSTSYPDATATNAGPYFYRVGVQQP